MPRSTARSIQRVAHRDVRGCKPAVPEEDRLVVALSSGLLAGDDLPELGVQVFLAQEALVDVCSEAAEPSLPALTPVVDDDLVHDRRERELDGAHRPVRHDESTGLDPVGAEERRRLGEPSRLDDDVRALDYLLPGFDHAHRLAERLLESRSECIPRLRTGARDPDLLEVEQVIEHGDVGEGSAAGADVPENPGSLPGQVAGSERRHRAGPALGDLGRVEDRARNARARVVERQQREL